MSQTDDNLQPFIKQMLGGLDGMLGIMDAQVLKMKDGIKTQEQAEELKKAFIDYKIDDKIEQMKVDLSELKNTK